MVWKKAGIDKSMYLKFEAGKSFEGTYQGYEERENPFYDVNIPNSSKIKYDYIITINDVDRVLSSTAKTLQEVQDLADSLKKTTDVVNSLSK